VNPDSADGVSIEALESAKRMADEVPRLYNALYLAIAIDRYRYGNRN